MPYVLLHVTDRSTRNHGKSRSIGLRLRQLPVRSDGCSAPTCSPRRTAPSCTRPAHCGTNQAVRQQEAEKVGNGQFETVSPRSNSLPSAADLPCNNMTKEPSIVMPPSKPAAIALKQAKASMSHPRSSRSFHVMSKPTGAACNLNCAYCFYLEKSALYPRGTKGTMSDEVLEAHIRQCFDCQSGPMVTLAW